MVTVRTDSVIWKALVGQWTLMDSLACPIGQLDSGIWEARVGLWIPSILIYRYTDIWVLIRPGVIDTRFECLGSLATALY